MCYFGILSLRKISLRIDKFEGKGLENKYNTKIINYDAQKIFIFEFALIHSFNLEGSIKNFFLEDLALIAEHPIVVNL